jgi:hypothetical protein
MRGVAPLCVITCRTGCTPGPRSASAMIDVRRLSALATGGLAEGSNCGVGPAEVTEDAVAAHPRKSAGRPGLEDGSA